MLVSQLGNQQFKVFTKNGVVFQSYSSLIAFKSDEGITYLTDKWGYSATTLKHLKLFLGITLSKKDIQSKIDSGEYKLVTQDFILSHM